MFLPICMYEVVPNRFPNLSVKIQAFPPALLKTHRLIDSGLMLVIRCNIYGHVWTNLHGMLSFRKNQTIKTET